VLQSRAVHSPSCRVRHPTRVVADRSGLADLYGLRDADTRCEAWEVDRQRQLRGGMWGAESSRDDRVRSGAHGKKTA
jgi:hypothetical protein